MKKKYLISANILICVLLVSAITYATTTIGNSIAIGTNLTVTSLANCDTIDTDANGLLSCGTDATGGSGNTFSNPLSLVGTNVIIDLASASGDGYLSAGDWSTFNSKQATITATNPLTLSGGTLTLDYASASGPGYLIAADWSTFNSKLGAISSSSFFTTGALEVDSTASISGAIQLGNLISCDTIDTDVSGNLICGTDATGAGTVTHGLLNPEFYTDVIPASASAGNLIIGEGDSWKALGIGASNSFLMSDGASMSWNDISNLTITGVLDFGGATSFELPNSSALSLNANGQAYVDTTKGQLVFYSGAEEVLMATRSFSFNIASDSFDEAPIANKRFNDLVTITGIHCLADSGTSIPFELEECDANGANCADVDSALICGTSNTNDDGSLSNASIDAGDYIYASISWSDVSGEVDWLIVTVEYKYDKQ